jgi:hypothetical protein
MDDIPKSAAWILSGASVAAALVSLVGLAPRVAGAYPGWLRFAIILIVVGFILGAIAVIINLFGLQREASGSNRLITPAITSTAAGMIFVIAGAAVIAFAYQETLSVHDVPRLTLSVADAAQSDLATVKVKFEADELNPGQFTVVDIVVVDRDTAANIPKHPQPYVSGRRVYRSAIGADSTGKIISEVDTDVHRKDSGIVVAEVWPGPLRDAQGGSTLASNDQDATTQLCSDITNTGTMRSCAYAIVPM